MWRGLLAATALAAFGCGETRAPSLAVSRAPIVGGDLDVGDPAVVALAADTLVLCSGTLVAPRSVLTAGHCAAPLGEGVPYFALFGADASHPTQRIRLGRQVVHPSYTGEGNPFDLAVVELTVASAVAPVPLASAELAPEDVGRTLRHVGFGVSDEVTNEGRGLKRQVSYPLNRLEPQQIWSGAPGKQTCSGASGGPALLVSPAGVEELVAVVSDGPSCHEDGADARVDTVGAWVRDTFAAWEPSADAGADSPGRAGCGAAPGPLSALVALCALAGVRRRNRQSAS
jgi:secreted trypsin-like serine protease